MLSRRWLINLALVTAIAVLTWIGLNVEETSEDDTDQRISTLRPADVERIQFVTPGLSLELARDAAGWQIRQPIQWPAHSDNVERLLNVLRLPANALAATADVNLAALGLEPPVATLRLNDTRLDFGATNNIGERRYLRVESQLFLLPDVHLAFATQGLPGMVDRRLLPQPETIASLRLPGIEILRDTAGDYRATDRPELTPERLAGLVANWQSVSASNIRPLDTGADPGDIIQVKLNNGVEIDFLLQSVEPEIVIANPQLGLQYHFRSDFRDQLIAPDGDS